MPKLNLFLSSESPHIDKAVEQLRREIGLTRIEHTRSLKVLLCNLFIYQNKKILVSRRKNKISTTKGNPLKIGANSFISALDALDDLGLIEQKKGKKTDNKTTSIRTTEDLLIWFDASNWSYNDIDSFNPQRITLKLNEDKKVFVDPSTTQFFTWLDFELKKYNDLLNASVICLPTKDGSLEQQRNITAHQGFIKHKHHPKDGELLFGGRLVGRSWVNISSEDRQKITINDESTVEVDRQASHINAMYEVATGAPYPSEYGDPYDIVVSERQVPRHIAKNLLSFSQGANTAKGVSQRVGRSYKKKANGDDAKQKDIDNLNEWNRFKKNTPGAKIHKVLMMKHYQVKDYYLRGKQYGDMIQCWEADLVFEVVRELTNRGVACLTVYDSFIVQSKYKDLVEDLVEKTRFVNRRNIVNLLEVDKEVPFTISNCAKYL